MIIDDEDRYLGHHCLGQTAGSESLSDMAYTKMLLNAIQLVPAHLKDSPYHAPDIATLHCVPPHGTSILSRRFSVHANNRGAGVVETAGAELTFGNSSERGLRLPAMRFKLEQEDPVFRLQVGVRLPSAHPDVFGSLER
jgi:hypothetical protein